jgi:hypothetical protein
VIPAWWSVALGIAGIWLTGQKDARGWILGVAAQVLWIARRRHRAVGHPSELAYGFVYARGHWRQDERRAP